MLFSFNQAAYLREALDSVLQQGYPDLEYIVVDPGSKDESREIICRGCMATASRIGSSSPIAAPGRLKQRVRKSNRRDVDYNADACLCPVLCKESLISSAAIRNVTSFLETAMSSTSRASG